MTQSAADIAREFLSVVWDGEAPDVETVSRALDRLLAQSHDVPYSDCSEDNRDPPAVDGPALFREVAERFPDYGMYPVADPLAPIDDDKMLAGAADDLADITMDLREVVWREDNLGASDAAWCFRLLYFHWGRHARELGLYLHARQLG